MSRMNKEKVILPLPYLLESSNNSTSHPFSFGTTNNEMDESFENLNLSTSVAPNRNSRQPVATETINQFLNRSSREVIKAKRQTHTRNYQTYKGKTIFFCGGRFLTSRALWAFSLSIFLLIAPSVLFLIFTCPWLWHHVSPAVPILFAYTFCLTLASMLKTSWTDPGILPRNLDSKGFPNEDQFGYRYSLMSDDSSFPLPKEIMIKNIPVRLKYCETCCIYRPPRASHCRQCDNCVGR
ncbi:MAG: hypothetical protein EXX96DRAFT_207920 [Benjaminiella poitrasii]|nr:MAG: hypothetical protein EXX96DRAFT_207920 [Benjaminiella poitrasii]